MDRRRLVIIYYKLNKTNMFSAKISREFNNNPLHQLIHLGHLKIQYLSFKSQHRCQNPCSGLLCCHGLSVLTLNLTLSIMKYAKNDFALFC